MLPSDLSNTGIPYNDKMTGARGCYEMSVPGTYSGSFYAFECSNGAVISELKTSDGNTEETNASASMFFSSIGDGALGSSPYFFPKGIYGTSMTVTSGQVKFWKQ